MSTIKTEDYQTGYDEGYALGWDDAMTGDYITEQQLAEAVQLLRRAKDTLKDGVESDYYLREHIVEFLMKVK